MTSASSADENTAGKILQPILPTMDICETSIYQKKSSENALVIAIFHVNNERLAQDENIKVIHTKSISLKNYD